MERIDLKVSVQKIKDSFLPLHEEIATFNNGRVISTIPTRSILFVFDDGYRYNFSIQSLGDSLNDFLSNTKSPNGCYWDWIEEHQSYRTSCECKFDSNNDKILEDEGFTYCPFCGGSIERN